MWSVILDQGLSVCQRLALAALSLGLFCMTGCQSLATCSAATSASVIPQSSIISEDRVATNRPIEIAKRAESPPIILVEHSQLQTDESWKLHKSQRQLPRYESSPKLRTVRVRPSFWDDLWLTDCPAPCCPGASSLCEQDEYDTACDHHECDSLCFGCDSSHSPSTLWRDAKGVVNWNNGLVLAGAGAIAIALHETDADQEVRDWVAEHPNRWGRHTDNVLGNLGEARYQAPVLLGLYGYSVWSQNEELHDVMGSVLSATTITGVSTIALKLITNTDQPSKAWHSGDYGFPSYSAASSFAIAAVLDEYYGANVGLPAYALASAISFSQIDDQEQDLSDVVFGGVMGFVIGKAVAGQHLCGNSKLKLTPFFHPTTGAPGVACEARF